MASTKVSPAKPIRQAQAPGLRPILSLPEAGGEGITTSSGRR
jgi:hypothetical protein